MSSPKPRKATLDLSLVVPIVGDAGVAGRDVAEGRMIPLLILDTEARADVAELIRVHKHLPPGDVKSQWGGRVNGDDDAIIVMLHFLRPMDVEIALLLSIERQGAIIDAMVTGGAAYLQAGEPGDRYITTMHADRMMIELPTDDFRPVWERLYLERMTSVMARRLGVRQRKARPVAERFIREMRQLTGLRLPS